MTSVYDATGKLRPVTVIAAGDNTLLRRLTAENDGYSAIQVGFGTQKESRVTKAVMGGFTKAGSEPKKLVREFRLVDAAFLLRVEAHFHCDVAVAVSGLLLQKCVAACFDDGHRRYYALRIIYAGHAQFFTQ